MLGIKPSSVGLVQSIAFPIAFLSLQCGFYHIFNPKQTKHLYIFLLSIVGSILVASLSFFVNTIFVEISLALINIGFTIFLFLWALPRLAKRGKFLTTLILNGSTAISTLLFNILEIQLILIISITLCFATFSVLFVILFDRIIDLMQAVSYSSVTDGLTGIYQKHYFKKKVNEAIDAGEPCSIIFSDIDNFKRLNDTEGHQVGDVMLVFAATVMKEVCEGIGIVGRYGGEEIVALITDRRSDPAIIAEKYRARIEKESKKQGYVPITVSVGFTRFDENITDADEFIRQADDAMYISKGSGKNKVTNFATIRAAAAAPPPLIPIQSNIPSNNGSDHQEAVSQPVTEQRSPGETLNKVIGNGDESPQIAELATHREINGGADSHSPEIIAAAARVDENPATHTPKDADPVLLLVEGDADHSDTNVIQHEVVNQNQQAADDSGLNENKQAADPTTENETTLKERQSSSRTKTKKAGGESGKSTARKKKPPEQPPSTPSPSNKDITITSDQSAPRIIRNPFAKRD